MSPLVGCDGAGPADSSEAEIQAWRLPAGPSRSAVPGGHSPAPVPTPPRSGDKQPFCEPRKPKLDCWKRSKSPRGSARYPDLPSMALDRGHAPLLRSAPALTSGP
ncbi:hypothetical protein P7K49_017161 [Saguinus oedipus]|uniref:Uncharacterized protein n=1 Tax=Saguinus oedipus TaxID=9490 RepID=A0ABQ9V2R3_SAGOE|nr:hypothetical protein P7K49_017161 [Saguinus oedipus]